MNKKTISIILSGLILFLLVLIFSFGNDKKIISDPISDIREVILNNSNSENNSELANIQITHVNDNYARAQSDLVNFFLIKNEVGWKIIISGEFFFCEKLEKFGFPAGFISDCVLQYPEAINIAQYQAGDYDPNSESQIIIANISNSQDPFCDCLTVESGGESYTFDYDGENEYEPGDTIVISVVEDNIVEIVEVIDEDDGDDNNNNEDDESEEIPDVYLNPDPETSQSNLFFLDIDNSQREIQIISDF
jgi:hypothetical protein